MIFLAVCDGPGPAPEAGFLKDRFPSAEVIEMSLGPRTAGQIVALAPHMIVLNPRARGDEGVELCSVLKADLATREVPLVLVVPRGCPAATRAKVLEAGADALLEEPVDPAELAALSVAMLRRRDDRFRAQVDQAEEGFLVHDGQGRIRDANRRACDTLGYSREELVALRLEDIHETFWLEGAQSAWKKIRAGLPHTRLDHLRRKDGTRLPVEIRLGRLEVGGEVLFLALLRDVREREAAERALGESERTFAAVFRSSPVANLLTSMPEGTVIDVNDVFLRDMVYRREELVGHRVRDLGMFDRPEDLGGVLAEMKEKGKVYGREVAFRTREGNLLTCLLSVVEVSIGGRPCRLSSVLDISGRKRQEEALRESEARFRAAFEDVNLSVCVLSTDGRFLRVNDATCRLLGYTRDELERMSVADVTHSDDLEIAPGFMERAIAGESGHAAFVKRYLRRDGGVVWGQVSSSLVRDSRGEPLCFIAHLQDVTELQLARENLEASSADLERRVKERTAEFESANLELEGFSYSVSHDLRAPLRAIDGFSRRVVDRYGPLLDEEGMRLLGVIRSNTRRMSELIDGLLAFSRAGRGEIRRTVVSSEALAGSVFLEIVSEADHRERIAFAVGELPDAWGDGRLLRQVWVNLLSNAVKFSAHSLSPRIEVSGAVEGDMTVYRVRDNGAGFDPAYAAKLFGVFQRLHGMTEFEGTGVGLALVRRIVSRHGGEVRAEGAVGEGACFSFSLPLRPERPPARLSGEERALRPRAPTA